MKNRLILLLPALLFATFAFGQHDLYLPWEFAGGPPCPVRDVVLHEGTLYAGTDCGLYKRLESGGVWEQQSGTPDSTVLFLAANAGAVVAVFRQYYWQYNVGYYALHFFNSTDSGASFVRQYRYEYNHWYDTYGYVPVQTTFSRLYALGDSSFALGARTCDHGCRSADLVSTDQGQHWAYQFLGSNYQYFLPHFASQADTVAIFDFDSLRLVAASNFQRITSSKIVPTFQSEAAGLVWTNDRITVAFQNGRYAYTDNLGQSWTTDSLPLAGINDFFYYENHYYWCTNSGFYRSPTVGPAVLETMYTRSGPLGDIYKARRGSNGWYLLAKTLLLWLPDGSNAALPVATEGMALADGTLDCLPGRLMFRNEDGLWWKSPDGNTWSVYENETAYAQHFRNFYVGDTFCLAQARPSNYQSALYRSVDEGETWSLALDHYGDDFVKNTLDNRVYVGRLFTSDGGLHWDMLAGFHYPTAALGDTLVANPGKISFDHGQNWQNLVLPAPGAAYASYYVYPLSGRTLYAFPTGSLPVYRSIDFGSTWEEIGTGEALNNLVGVAGVSYLVGRNTYLQEGRTLTLFPVSDQRYFTLRHTPFSKILLLPGQYPRLDFGRLVQKDSTVYVARQRGVWRISDCYTDHPFPTPPRDTAICQGNAVLFHGDTLRTPGTYTRQIPGLTTLCDSVDVLRLQVNLIQKSWSTQICKGDTLVWNGQAYAAQGSYTQHLSTATGCDSMVTLYLGFYPTTANLTIPLCAEDTVQVQGQAIFAPGQYIFHLTSFAGCDSTLMVNAFDAQDTFTYVRTICAGASYTVFNHVYTETGEYWFTAFPITYCSRLYHVSLTVLPDAAITLDTFVTVGTAIYGQIINSDTSFTVLVAGPNSCDKIVTINAHTTVGIDQINAGREIQIFPNPFRDQLTLRWPAGESAQVRLYDAQGRICREARLPGPKVVWDTGDLPAGLYRAEIRLGERYFAWKLVKMP